MALHPAGSSDHITQGAGKHSYSLLTERVRAKYPLILICFPESEGNEEKSTLHLRFNKKSVGSETGSRT